MQTTWCGDPMVDDVLGRMAMIDGDVACDSNTTTVVHARGFRTSDGLICKAVNVKTFDYYSKDGKNVWGKGAVIEFKCSGSEYTMHLQWRPYKDKLGSIELDK